MQRARSMSAAATSEAASFRVPARYKFQKHLGSGSYGVVASFHDQERGRDVAIKRVKRVFDNYLVLRRTLREIRLMSHFRHPNLMRLHKVLEATGGDLYISIELMDCDLDTLVHTKRVVLTDQQVRCFTAQIMLGLVAMHAGHVIHRDLKPANIFVRLNRGQVKIGDLGLSRGIALNDESGEATHPSGELLTEYVVTRWYRAPEVLLSRSKYGPPVDVWSVGCIVYEMCSRKALFPGKNSYDQLKRIVAVLGGPDEADTSWVPRESMPLLQKCCAGSGSQRGQSFAAICSGICSHDGADLMQQMCLFNPNKRIGVEEALMHPFLAGITSEQDRKTAKAIDPADVTYDRVFDGVGKSGEHAALEQLGQLLRREVSKFNPTRRDTTPERSQGERVLKTNSTSRTPRSGPPNPAEASLTAVSGGGSARGSSTSKAVHSGTEHHSAVLSSSNLAQQPEHHEGLASWQRRRSEPEADYWARRTAASRGGHAADVSPQPRRRSADDGRPTGRDSSRNLENPDCKRVAPGEEHKPLSMTLPAPPANGSAPAAFWPPSEDKKPPLRSSGRAEYAVGGPKRRVPGCSGGSVGTVSTRATPPSTRAGTEASTRASSRIASTSRPRVPSLGPQGTTQWVSEPEGFLHGHAGPADAATASPRAGPPELFQRAPRRNEAQHSSRRTNCWLAPEDAGTNQADRNSHSIGMHEQRGSQSLRSLRESASTSHPVLPPPDLDRPLRHESLASLDDVLREMKALLRNAPECDNVPEPLKVQERSVSRSAAPVVRTSASQSKLSSRGTSRPSTGLRGHRAAAVGRGADTTTDDRSPSAQRGSQRRHPPQRSAENRASSRQRSHDELDFAVPEPMGPGVGGTHHTPRRQRHGEAAAAPTPPWAESRKPLESLEVDGNSAGPPVPWARGGSTRNLHVSEQDWKHLQQPGIMLPSRPLTRSSSQVKRAAASENNAANTSLSGLGFIF